MPRINGQKSCSALLRLRSHSRGRASLSGLLPRWGASHQPRWQGSTFCRVPSFLSLSWNPHPKARQSSPFYVGPRERYLLTEEGNPTAWSFIGNVCPTRGFNGLFLEHISLIKKSYHYWPWKFQSENFLMLRNAHLFFQIWRLCLIWNQPLCIIIYKITASKSGFTKNP